MYEDEVMAPRRAVFLGALRSAVKRVPIWGFCWVAVLLASAGLALPWKDWFEGTLGNSYAPGEVLAGMSETFRADHREVLGDLRGGSARSAAVVAALIVLFGVFAAGGWLQVFLERTSGHSLRRFLWGGARYFWRFLRVALLTLLSFALLSWVMQGWVWETALELLFDAQEGNLEVFESERSAMWVGWFQAGAYALGIALIFVWGDYTRTRLALHDTRSALWAGLCTWLMILWNPIRTLRPLFLIFLVELGVVLGIGALSWDVNVGIDASAGWRTVAVLFLAGQVALVWQTISRGARYHAAVNVSRRIIPPLAQPDPWAGRVGGPGGPQYPIVDTDDYGVSI